MAETMTMAELLERVRDSYQDYSGAIASVPADSLTRPGTIGDWSIRDVIAHIGADERWMAGQVEALRFETLPTTGSCYGIDSPPPAGMDWNSQDARNAWQRERLGDLSLEDVQAMATEAHARLVAVITSLSDSQLSEELTIAPLGTVGWIRQRKDGEAGWPLWQWLRGVTYHHYADHAEGIRAAAAGR